MNSDIYSNETEIEHNESVIEDEWCPENKPVSRQELWVNALTLELAEIKMPSSNHDKSLRNIT